jgi:DNA-binding response OmpR family regulator
LSGESPESAPPTILVVDDEPSLRDALTYTLRNEGYRVVAAANGVEAIQAARRQRPQVVVLDVMLPGIDGLQVCRTLRSESTVPILLLSAKGEEIDRVVGLEVGADDYLPKPFAMRELLARIRAMLRRVEMMTPQPNVGTRCRPRTNRRPVTPERSQLTIRQSCWEI